MPIELKPCPFCGGKAQLRYDIMGCYYIECQQCRIKTTVFDALVGGKKMAIETWNRRTEK